MNISNFKIIEKVIKPYKIYNLYYFKKIKGFSLDSRTLKKGDAYIALAGKHKDGHDFIDSAAKKGAAMIISTRYIKTNPKIPQFIVEDSYQALRDIIVFLRKKYKKATVVGITGSLGKTTTKEMLSFILKPYKKVLKSKATENNILGVAKTFFSYHGHDLVICELGTNRKGEIKSLAGLIQPDLGIVTSIKPTHLEGLGNMGKIKEEKLSLFRQNRKTKAVLNGRDSSLSKVKLKNKTFWFGKNKKNNLYYRFRKRQDNKVYFKILDKYELVIPLRFEGFVDNYLAAVLAAHLLGFSYRDIILRMNSFKKFPPMRMEKKIRGNYYILNDAYNANPYSFRQALEVLRHFKLPKVVIAADMLELGAKSAYYHRNLASQIIKTNCQYCLTYGIYAKIINEQLKKINYRNAFHFSSHKKIALFLRRKLKNRKCLIFLKGSRKMQLEEVVKYL
ncbi:MAG: UDP-N-acetylmuramoyl-tripeptide--D-alanyl-D-alanine ligase [Candidatus Omnitrophica bacterium]|nr:UDP-N-acetylmuramoyl-tripeptide--D-alanyl-D-alanine ligase [Candidatus Omnitrophota bacterium]MCF7877024.1 UDP-N-acetylmuramoyl-tripeptide--D-alanyl-D-alanine ligase [Candidatus Omnitrophota bacterium]MCF7877856.1 UDP-N-acetylmuramoyl-tripeptide--D-alanyl-D-alanine ligase [Candidatus Omnitrophota bacterium]MCF7892548.1 UDP-N-acetylmuramoyl-tripeptide--D-alanyl-D-alanine ligase [Candidatus Omnitrophota bacterium]